MVVRARALVVARRRCGEHCTFDKMLSDKSVKVRRCASACDNRRDARAKTATKTSDRPTDRPTGFLVVGVFRRISRPFEGVPSARRVVDQWLSRRGAKFVFRRQIRFVRANT